MNLSSRIICLLQWFLTPSTRRYRLYSKTRTHASSEWVHLVTQVWRSSVDSPIWAFADGLTVAHPSRAHLLPDGRQVTKPRSRTLDQSQLMEC